MWRWWWGGMGRRTAGGTRGSGGGGGRRCAWNPSSRWSRGKHRVLRGIGAMLARHHVKQSVSLPWHAPSDRTLNLEDVAVGDNRWRAAGGGRRQLRRCPLRGPALAIYPPLELEDRWLVAAAVVRSHLSLTLPPPLLSPERLRMGIRVGSRVIAFTC